MVGYPSNSLASCSYNIFETATLHTHISVQINRRIDTLLLPSTQTINCYWLKVGDANDSRKTSPRHFFT